MALPPQQIRIKRKHVEETPVTFLQFENSETNKRHRSGRNWVYQRQVITTAQNAEVPTLTPIPNLTGAAPPVIRTSQPGDEWRAATGAQLSYSQPVLTVTSPSTSDEPVMTSVGAGKPKSVDEPRRFHLSKTALSALARVQRAGEGGGGGGGGGSGIVKRSRHGPVFVEQRKKKVPKKRLGTLPTMVKEELQVLSSHDSDNDVQMTDGEGGTSTTTGTSRLRYKRPNTRSRNSSRRPLPHVDRLSSEGVTRASAEVDRWVLDEIAAALQEEVARAGPALATSNGKFKPRAPAQRFADRHPSQAPSSTDGSVVGDGSDGDDSAEETGDEGNAVYDTYVRVPADSVAERVSADQVGYLVIRSGEEEENFYYGAEDDSSDEDGEESDENAENHFSTDYPEDEVESDDEHGRMPYVYRNGNASDEEEYDGGIVAWEGSGAGSDQEQELGPAPEPESESEPGPVPESSMDSGVVAGEDWDAAMAKIRRFNRKHDVFG